LKKFIILWFLITIVSPVYGGNIDSILIVCDEWKDYTNKDGTGAYWEIVKTVYEPVGIKVTTSVVPWTRVKHMVKEKKADALVGDYYYKNVNPNHYLYPKWHISVEDPVVAVFKKDKFKDWETTGIKSLAGKRVVWIRGYDFDTIFLQSTGVIKHEVTTVSQGLELIASGRDDYFFDYESSIRYEAKKIGIDIDKDYEIKTAKLGSKLYVVFSLIDFHMMISVLNTVIAFPPTFV